MKTNTDRFGVALLRICLLILLSGIYVAGQERSMGYLKLKVQPGRAGVFVDSKYVGPAANYGFSRKYALAAGEHQITLSDPRCQDYSTKVTVEAGKTLTLTQSLQTLPLASPPFGTLRVEGGANKFSAVFVNGKYMGHVDEFNNFLQGMLLNPGEYALKVVSQAGNTELEEKIKIEENKTTRVHVPPAGAS